MPEKHYSWCSWILNAEKYSFWQKKKQYIIRSISSYFTVHFIYKSIFPKFGCFVTFISMKKTFKIPYQYDIILLFNFIETVFSDESLGFFPIQLSDRELVIFYGPTIIHFKWRIVIGNSRPLLLLQIYVNSQHELI